MKETMEQSSPAEDSYGGIEDVLDNLIHREEHISKSSFGEMDKRARILQDGSVMSNIGRWLKEERSYAITGGAILFSCLTIAFFFGMTIGRLYEVTNRHQIVFQGQVFEMIAIAKSKDGNRDIFMPVYEVKP